MYIVQLGMVLDYTEFNNVGLEYTVTAKVGCPA